MGDTVNGRPHERSNDFTDGLTDDEQTDLARDAARAGLTTMQVDHAMRRGGLRAVRELVDRRTSR